MAKDTSARAPASVIQAGHDAASVPADRFKSIKLAAALLLVLFAIASAARLGTRPSCIDFYEFWVVGRAVGKHQAQDVYTDAERKRLGELYWNEALSAQMTGATPDVPSKRIQAAQQRQVLETYSTPWMYTLIGLVSSDDYDVDQGRFQLLSTLAFVLAIAVLGRVLGYSALGIAVCAWIFTSPWFKPFSDEVIAGNVNRLQVAFLALFAWVETRERWKQRELLSGFVLGSAILFKPNLAIAVVVLGIGWGITRQFDKLARQFAGMTVGALAAFVISSVYFGSMRAWIDWLHTIPELLSQGASAGGNYAFSRLLLDRARFSTTRALPLEFLVIVVIALVRARSRPQREVAKELGSADDRARDRAAFDILLVGLGATISVLATDLVWLHYYVLCVPLALFVLRPASVGAAGAGRWALRAMGLIGVALVSLQVLIYVLDIPRPSAASPYVNIGALLLVVTSLVDLVRYSRLPGRVRAGVS